MQTSHGRRRRGGIAVLAVAVAALIAPAGAAHADAVADGNWWYSAFGADEVHGEGWTGEGIKVAVVDQQINDTLPVFEGTNLTVSPRPLCGDDTDDVVTTDLTEGSLHGSGMTALLIGNGEGNGAVRGIAPGADVTFYGYGSELCVISADGNGNLTGGYSEAIRTAVADGNKIITTSVAFDEARPDEVSAVAEALAQGVIIVAATPNSTTDTSSYPSQLNGVVSVNAFDANGMLNADEVTGAPNIWPEVTVIAPGVDVASVNWDAEKLESGSSNAAPLVAGILAAAWQKYPDATSNQLIQSLIHNTTPDDHPLSRNMENGAGYGPVSLRHMLAVDPAQYPDENPLMDKASGQPTAAQVADAGAQDGATPAPAASDAPATAESAESAPDAMPLVVGGIGVLVLVTALVFTIVRVRRGRNGPTQGENR
ncbi:S8 family serine peptidase [Microbacterium sp. P01]|uniref:S8 family peptidase n=1 Tax=Microbacterium sp. P01 TaxID=3366261 RepID=UPI00367211E5